MQNRLIQVVVCCLVAGYLFAGFIGVSHIGIMGQEMNGQTVACPFMPGVVICNMTPMQHVAAAQTMFTAFVQLDFSTFVLLILSLLIAATLSKLRQKPKPSVVSPTTFTTVQLYESPRFALQEAYSNGILNPKLF